MRTARPASIDGTAGQAPTRLDDRWTLVNGQWLYARMSAGPAPAGAPAIVLVHGYGASSRYMAPAAAELARTFPVHAPDLPGFGRSDKPRRIYDLAALADALASWMCAAGIESAVLVGNSFGCQIITAFALRHPARLSHAVLIGPSVDAHARSAVQQVLRLLADAVFEPPSLIFIQARDYLKAGPRRMLRTLQIMLRDRIEARLPHIRAPLLVVRGEHDPIAPQRWAEEVARLAPGGGRVVVIPGAGHAVNYSAPVTFALVIRSFLDRVPASEPERGARS